MAAQQPQQNMLIDPNLLPQVQQTGGQLGLIRMMQQANQIPQAPMPQPRTVGQGLAQGGISFAQNFMQARQNGKINRMIEQQLTAQRDAQLAEAKQTQQLRDYFVSKGKDPREALFLARHATAAQAAIENEQKMADEQAKAQAKAEAAQSEWQSNYDAAKSVQGGFDIENNLAKLKAFQPKTEEDAAAVGAAITEMENRLSRITAMSQGAANNPTAFANLFGREGKRYNPLPEEAANLTGANLSNDQAALDLELNQQYSPYERNLKQIVDTDLANRGLRETADQNIDFNRKVEQEALRRDPSVNPYQYATLSDVLMNNGAHAFDPKMNNGVKGVYGDMTNQASQYTRSPNGQLQMRLPQNNIFGIPTAPQMYMPVANPGSGVQMPLQVPLPGQPVPAQQAFNPAQQPTVQPAPPVQTAQHIPLTPQQQGEAARQSALNSLGQAGQAIYGGAKGLAGFGLDVGEGVQGFFGLPFNPVDSLGYNRNTLNGLR